MKQFVKLWRGQKKPMDSEKISFRHVSWLVFTNVLFLASPFCATALAGSDSIITKLNNTGVLYVGTRTHAAPFASKVNETQFAGFTIDLIEQISFGISDDLGKPIITKLSPVTVKNRLKMVQDRKVDMVCGSTTVTWSREKFVDFSIPFFIDGIRLLAQRKHALSGVFSLQTSTIGIPDSKFIHGVITSHLPNAKIKKFKTVASAMIALEKGLIHAYSNDGSKLEHLRVNSRQANNLVLLPKSGVLEWEYFACVLPEDQSKFKDLVNNQILKMLRGLDNFSGTYAEIYFRWFGANGVIQIPLDASRQNKLTSFDIWLR